MTDEKLLFWDQEAVRLGAFSPESRRPGGWFLHLRLWADGPGQPCSTARVSPAAACWLAAGQGCRPQTLLLQRSPGSRDPSHQAQASLGARVPLPRPGDCSFTLMPRATEAPSFPAPGTSSVEPRIPTSASGQERAPPEGSDLAEQNGPVHKATRAPPPGAGLRLPGPGPGSGPAPAPEDRCHWLF